MATIKEFAIIAAISAILYCCELFIRKKIDAGDFLPSAIQGHYAQVLTILDDRDLRYCRKIKKYARDHLKKALALSSDSSQTDQYLKDIFYNPNYETTKSWAMLFIRYHLENAYELHRDATETYSLRQLAVSLDEEIKKIIPNSSTLPRSFLDMFPMHWYFEYLEESENIKREEEKVKHCQEKVQEISSAVEQIWAFTIYRNAYVRIQSDLVSFIEKLVSKKNRTIQAIYSEALAYSYYHIFNIEPLMDEFFKLEEWSLDAGARVKALANVLIGRKIITSDAKETLSNILASKEDIKVIVQDASFEYISIFSDEDEEDIDS